MRRSLCKPLYITTSPCRVRQAVPRCPSTRYMQRNCQCNAHPFGFGPPLKPAGTCSKSPCPYWSPCSVAVCDPGLIEGRSPVLPSEPDLKGKDVRANWNAVALAFLGDTVWELYVRRRFFYPPKKTSQYYEKVMLKVRAEAQVNLSSLRSQTHTYPCHSNFSTPETLFTVGLQRASSHLMQLMVCA